MLPYLRLFRLPNLLIIALTMVLVRVFLVSPAFTQQGITMKFSNPGFLMLVLATVCIAAAGYLVNDHFDLGIDRINRPDSMPLGRSVPEKMVLPLYILLNSIGLCLGLMAAIQAGCWELSLVFPGIILLLGLYASWIKKMLFWGNFLVSLLVAFTVIVGGLFELTALTEHPEALLRMAQHSSLLVNFLWFYAIFAFFVTFLREIIKDTADADGDRRFGCRSLPIVLGIHGTKQLVTLLVLLLVSALACCQLILFRGRLVWNIYMTALVQVPLPVMAILWIKAGNAKEFRRVHLLVKAVMVAGIISMILIKF